MIGTVVSALTVVGADDPPGLAVVAISILVPMAVLAVALVGAGVWRSCRRRLERRRVSPPAAPSSWLETLWEMLGRKRAPATVTTSQAVRVKRDAARSAAERARSSRQQKEDMRQLDEAFAKIVQPDLENVPSVIEYVSRQQPEVAQFAQLLLGDGGRVLTSWGPKQMAVWHLEIQRGNWVVLLRSERGFTDPATVARAVNDSSPSLNDYFHMGLAVFAWARATGVPFRLDEPDDFDHDLVECGCHALDWLNEGNGDALDRVYGAWIEYRHNYWGLEGEALRTLQADSVAAMEDAAAARSA